MMVKTLRTAAAWFALLILAGATLTGNLLAQNASAQGAPGQQTRSARLQALSEELMERGRQERAAAHAYAQGLGIEMRRQLPGGGILELQRLAPGQGKRLRPVFYLTNNLDAADTVSTDEVWPGGSAGLSLDGSGMVVAEWDGGAIFVEHPDLAGRVNQMDGPTAVSGHSTHVAGTLIGAGAWLLPQARGMAYAAELDAWDWNFDTAEMAAAAAGGQLISNHSYGIAAGWIYTGDPNPPNTWWWIGGADPADVEDPYFGYYDSESQLWDQIAFDAPYYLIVKAAGNDRSDIGPAPGEEYTVIDQEGTPLFTSTLPRNPDCWPGGYDCLPTHSVAKNILTVGAVDDLPGGYSPLAGPASVAMADFSSWGPTDDGRIKPDLVGNGMFLYSTWPDSPYFAAAAGTSMAAPNVTGSLLLLQQHFQDLHGPGQFLRAATLKALAIHTADEAGPAPGPDYAFGWGLLNTLRAAEVISEDGANHLIIEDSLADGATRQHSFSVSDADSVVTATLVWADPAAEPVALALDAPDLRLVNDLDLRISRGASIWYPWVLDPANPSAAATTGDNFRDNVEQVTIDAAGTGNYTVTVGHDGSLQGGSQDYALIISVEPPAPTGSGLLIDEDFSGGMPPGWSVHTDWGVSWTVNDPVPGDDHFDNLTGGSGRYAMVYNDFGKSLTSLRTYAMDLSAFSGAVLRFNSILVFYDYLESLNVDVSTDGGANWINVWQWVGFNPWPTLYNLDLSGYAGEPDFRLQFRWDSGFDGGGDTWQIDNVQFEVFGGPGGGDPPGPATDPGPANGAIDQGIDSTLSWTAGSLADSHDLYFGTANPPADGEFQGNQAGTVFDPGPLAYGTTYYWRIDEVNGDGTTPGATWSFTTEAEPLALPGQATSPNPADGASGIATDSVLSWSAGSLAASHDVYFGTTPTLGPADFQGNQAAVDFDPGMLDPSTTYYWRIDELNASGTTTGATWQFATLAATETMHLAQLQGSAQPGSRSRWNAVVTVTVHDASAAPQAGVLVEGGWSGGANGTGSCSTDDQGTCSIEKSNLKQNVASVSFDVTQLSKAGFAYTPADNAVSDSITVAVNDTNALPTAVDDSFQTDVDAAVAGNLLDNDDPGDGPASVESHTEPTSGSLALNVSDGSFTYTPAAGFEGEDSFNYRIVDQDGDISAYATVTLRVIAGDPPPPSGAPSISLNPYKAKGYQHVGVSWADFSGGPLEIYRGQLLLTDQVAGAAGSYDDDIGVKGGGQTYQYSVCEAGGGNCVSATTGF